MHSQRNTSSHKAVVIEGYEPAINIEPFFTALPHVMERKNIFKLCVFFSDFKNTVSSKSVTFNYIVPFVAWFGRKLGYSGWYQKHILHL